MVSVTEDTGAVRVPAVGAPRYWLRLAMGVLALGLGVAAFAWPSATVHVIGFLFGLNLLVTGFGRAATLSFEPDRPLSQRLLGITFGILTGILGIVCLGNVTGSVAVLVVVVAVGWLLDGLVRLFSVFSRPREPHIGWLIGTGLVMILGAVAVLVWPEVGLVTFVAIGATVLALVGIAQIASAIAGLRAAKA